MNEETFVVPAFASNGLNIFSSPDLRERVLFEIALPQLSWNTGRETFVRLQTGLLCKIVLLGPSIFFSLVGNMATNSPWLVLFNLLSKLDLSILDWTLTCGAKIMKFNKGLLTFGFFIPLVEADVAAEVTWSLVGGLEELQDPSSRSCSRICLFSQSASPDCK